MISIEAANQDAEFREQLRAALAGEFELGDRVGVGGFAEVFAARDVRLGREVAIKTMRRDFYGVPSIRERFLREARTVAQLRHPHILPVYTVGEGDDVAYFVMPLVRGESLAAYLERVGRLPIDEVRRLVGEMAAALQHAHDAGLVHRDVKPENVLLEGAERRVLVMDFGIAKAAAFEAPSVTGTGMIVGTPLYMSPEQASGERELDGRADLYSLGVVAFQMLTGTVPFSGTSMQAVIVKHITETAPPVRAHRPDCPEELAALVARCLEKAPAKRFTAARDVIGALTGEVSPDIGRPTQRADPVVAFRRLVVAMAVLSLVGLGYDVIDNRTLDFAPGVAALAALVAALAYGPVWRAGVSFSDAVRGRRTSATEARQVTPTAAYGAHAAVVTAARSDRAVIAGLLARMPRSQRDQLPLVLRAADTMVARTRELSRQLAQLDRVASPGGERAAAAERRLLLPEVNVRRDVLAGQLKTSALALSHLATLVQRVEVQGTHGLEAELRAAVEDRTGA